MKYIDIFGQSLLIPAGLGLGLAGAFSTDVLWLFAVCQFFLGVWQVLGCILCLIWHPKGNSSRKKYLLIVLVYLTSLFVLTRIIPEHIQVPEMVGIAYFTIPAWTLAIWYYLITLRGYFPKIKRGFLPHLSF